MLNRSQPAPDVWPLLRAAGFTMRQIPWRDPANPLPPLRMFYAVPGHLVVVLESAVRRSSDTVTITELAVYPELTDLAIATRGPVERAHARHFAITFEFRTPPSVIGAASIAALSATVPRRAQR